MTSNTAIVIAKIDGEYQVAIANTKKLFSNNWHDRISAIRSLTESDDVTFRYYAQAYAHAEGMRAKRKLPEDTEIFEVEVVDRYTVRRM